MKLSFPQSALRRYGMGKAPLRLRPLVRTRGRCDPGEAGYSLVELLVVVVLLGFIALGIGGGIHFGARVWEASEQRIASDNDYTRAHALLRSLLGAALPRKQAGFVTFEGTPSRVTFDAEALPALGIAGLARIELEIAFRNGRKGLRVRASPLANPADKREAILVDDIGSVEFSFLDSTSDVPAWLASWRDRQRLPDAVRLTGVRAASWPMFVARLPISQVAKCAFDPVSYSCRDS